MRHLHHRPLVTAVVGYGLVIGLLATPAWTLSADDVVQSQSARQQSVAVADIARPGWGMLALAILLIANIVRRRSR